MNVLGRYFMAVRLTFLMVSLCVSGLSLASNIPGKPTNLQITGVHDLTITLTWEKPLTTAGAPVELRYTVSCTAIGGVSERLTTETESAQFDLQADTRYTIHVKAIRRDDHRIQGDWSDTLTVHSRDFVPAKPTNLRVTHVARLAVTVAWEKPQTTVTGIPDTSSLYYVIIYRNLESRMTRQILKYTPSALLNLDANSRYAIQVRAYKTFNPHVSGVWSDTLTLKTNESVPNMPPTNVKVVSNTPSSITVSWDPIPERGRNGIIQGYVVFYGEQGVPESGWSKRDVKLVYSKELTSLTTGMKYNVKVAGYTKVGRGAKSGTQPIIVGVPGKPTNLQITGVHDLTITLTWEKPLTTAGAPVELRYTVSYTAMGVSERLTTETESAQFDLQADTRYTIHVKAIRRDDHQIQGDWSDTLTVLSRDFVPAKPTNLRVTHVARLAVTVAWEKPQTTVTEIPDTSSLYYVIIYRNLESRMTRQIRKYTPSALLYLDANSRYAIQVRAYKTFNPRVSGVLSDTLTLKTNESVPSVPPTNVKVVSNTPSSITVSWDPIPERGRNGIIQGYVVFYGEQGVPDSSWSIRDVKLVYSKELTSLTTGMKYNVKVAGYTKVGRGAKSGTQPIIVGGQFITTTKKTKTTTQKPTTLKPTSTMKQTTKLSTKSSTLAATTVLTQKPQKPSTVMSRTIFMQVNTLPSVATKERLQTTGVVFSRESNKRSSTYSKSARKTTTEAAVYQSTLPVALARKADKESKSGGSFKKILLIGVPAAGALLLIIVLSAVFVSRSRRARKRRRQNGEIPLQQIKARRTRKTSIDAVTRGASSIRYEPPQPHFTLADDSMTEGLLQQSDETECVTVGILEPNGSLPRAAAEDAPLLPAGHPEKCKLRVDLNAEQGELAEDCTSGLYDSIGSLKGVGCKNTAKNDVDKRYVTHNQMTATRDKCPLTPPAQTPPQENGHFERRNGEEAKAASQGDIYENMQCAEHLYETLGLQNKEVPLYENTRGLRNPWENNGDKDAGYEPIPV